MTRKTIKLTIEIEVAHAKSNLMIESALVNRVRKQLPLLIGELDFIELTAQYDDEITIDVNVTK